MYKITDIFWERANLNFVFDKNITNDIFLVKDNTSVKLQAKNNVAVINITNASNGAMLESNVWKLTADSDSIVIDTPLIERLADKSRNFFYNSNKYAYIVNFSIDDEFGLNIMTSYMIVNLKPQKPYRLAETKSFKSRLVILAKRLIYIVFNLIYRFARVFHKKGKNILFLTENGNKPSGNLKALYEYVKQYDYNTNLFAINRFVGSVGLLTQIKEIFIIAKSDIIFVDNYTPILAYVKLSKEVRLIQLWHAGVGFKAVGYARFGAKGSPHPFYICHRHYTDVIVDNERLADIYKEVFGVSRDIIKSYGMPKLDGYLTKEKIEKDTADLYKLNPMLKDCKVILFSPTFRGVGFHDAYYDYSQLNLKAIYDFCEHNNFIFVVKMHPFVKEPIKIPEEYQNRIFDYSDIDINSLIYVSDVMITDYSSCAYEFSLFNRPLIFFRYDKENYEYDRPMHTLDVFSDRQYEVRKFSEVIDVLEEIKDIIPTDRFDGFEFSTDLGACKKIKEEIIDKYNWLTFSSLGTIVRAFVLQNM